MQIGRKLLEVISAVLKAAETKRADIALREALRDAHFSPPERRAISQLVFLYYRWFGWLDRTKPLRGQLEHALQLSDELAAGSLSDAEMISKALPPWVAEVMEVTPALLREWQREPRLWLRARPGQGSALSKSLGHCEGHPSVPDALWYTGTEDLFRSPRFHEGQFELQDLSSQIVGHLCHPEPGETWWDACAGEGGKTLHLCDLMNKKGLVWASDPAQWRLARLKRRAARAGIFNYRAKTWTQKDGLPTKTKFDGILVDAPCSGIGTWGRNPHARWTLRPDDVTELAALQRDLLAKAAGSVKPGGKLVYSVCTLARPETRGVAESFERAHPDFEPLMTQSVLGGEPAARFELRPEDLRANGMFVALWRRRK